MHPMMVVKPTVSLKIRYPMMAALTISTYPSGATTEAGAFFMAMTTSNAETVPIIPDNTKNPINRGAAPIKVISILVMNVHTKRQMRQRHVPKTPSTKSISRGGLVLPSVFVVSKYIANVKAEQKHTTDKHCQSRGYAGS